MVMLSVRNAWGHSPGPYYLWASPKDISLTRANVVAGSALVVLTTIARPSRNFRKTSFITHKSWMVHSTLRATQRGHGEREREYVNLRSAFIGVEGGVPRISRVHSLLVNLKHKSGN